MKKLILVILLFVPFLGNTQDSNLENWWIYYGNKQIKSKWNWHSEVQYRNYNFISDLEQLLLRTGFGYNLTENNNNILLGYGYILSENYIDGTDEKEDVHENRIYQQFITKQSFSRVSLQHRYRFEQRFIDDDFRLRFRYFLSINIALNHKEITDKTLYLSAYNEIFINTDDNIFDRNRIYAGLGYRFSKNIRIELGYMNQFLPDTNRDQLNMIAFINF
jgi:hypothetical protein